MVILEEKDITDIVLIAGIFSVVVVINLFMKLPKAGSGVYLLAITSLISIIYSFIVLRKKKEERVIDKTILEESLVVVEEEIVE